jgi:DNA gyrase subunit B
VFDRYNKQFKLTEARWKRFTRLLKQYEGWAAALRAAHGQSIVTFLEQSRLIEEGVTDVDGLLRLIRRGSNDGEAYSTELVREGATELVVRTIEARTGLASSYNVRHSTLEANEYQHLAEVHRELVELVGSPPFEVALGDTAKDAPTFVGLRESILEVAQKGVHYYRFKGLGEMDSEELRETTMDPATRTLVKVTVEDAASADLVFSMLMGDQVEPRRAFIENNASQVANLDV